METDLGYGRVTICCRYGSIRRSKKNAFYYKGNMASSGAEIRINGRAIQHGLYNEIWGKALHPSQNRFLAQIDILSDQAEALPDTKAAKNGLREDDAKVAALFSWIRANIPEPIKEEGREQMLVQMLNKNVVPVVPQKGSLGSSGDLAPLAHMTLPMLGLGEAVYEGKRLSGAEAMRLAGIETLDTLVSKEGLGMTNGTCAMTSVGAVTLYDALCAAQLADIISSMTLEALTGLRSAFDPRIHAVRGQKGQIKVAENMRMLLENSEILDHCQQDRVQDAYALRCIPQIHGACRDALQFVQEKVEIELNAVTDNPLLFLDDEAVISGGNFHGEPMALPFDLLGIAISELADVSERRIERMVNAALSNGLTPFLTTQEGLNSGFMIVQYAAASMVSENKIYAHPASVDSIPSSANQEDIVSMGTTAARKARMILQNTQDVLADELLCACQAIDIRRRLNTHGQGITPLHEAVLSLVRETVPFYEIDREIWPDLRSVEKIIRSDSILSLAEKHLPNFG